MAKQVSRKVATKVALTVVQGGKKPQRTGKVLPDLSNVNPLDAMITTLMDNKTSEGNTQMMLTKYMFDGASFDDVFLGKYAAQQRKEKMSFIDNEVLRKVSPHYGEVIDAWNKAKSAKSPSENEKAAQDVLSDKIDAPRQMAKRALQALAYLRSIKAYTFIVQEKSVKVVFDRIEKDKDGKVIKTTQEEDIMSGRAITRKGVPLLPQGVSGRTGTGQITETTATKVEQAIQRTKDANLTTALDTTSKLLLTEKGAPVKLNQHLSMKADETLIALIKREFMDEGEVDSKTFVLWCLEHGLRVDGKEPKQPMSADDAEKMEHKAVRKTVPPTTPAKVVTKAANRAAIKTAAIKKTAKAK